MPFKCIECENTFVFAEQLEKHRTAHEKNNKYDKFRSTSSGAINNDYKLEKLNLCEFAMPLAAKLNKHIIKKTGRRERPFKCNQCDHASHHANNLKKHMKVHSEERPYKCNQCDYAEKHLRNLTTHIGKHEGIVYGCDQCPYKTSQKSNLKMHVESKHTRILYACDQCRYKASLKGRLKIHVESKHEGIPAISVILKQDIKPV